MFLSSPICFMLSINASTSMITWLSGPHCMYTPDSAFILCNQIEKRKLSSVSNQLRLAYFKPYRLFGSLALGWLLEPFFSRPLRKTISVGKFTYSSLFTLPYRKTAVTSRYYMTMLASPRTTRIKYTTAILTNGAEIIWKSISGCCQKLCATNRVF